MSTAYIDAHTLRVRTEYDRTLHDHAQPYGCHRCTRAFHETRPTGWDYDPDGTPVLCPPCAQEARRWAAQMAKTKRRTHCPHDHALVEGNTYREPHRPHLIQCLTCRRERSRKASRARRARKAAA